MCRFLWVLMFSLACQHGALAGFHYQTDFSPQDFQARRAAIYAAIGDNVAIIQGAEEVQGFIIFRQSNTFYYLSGLESPSAYLVLDGKKRRATLYLPHRDEERERVEGQVLSAEDAELIMQLTGVDEVRPIEKMAGDFTYKFLRGPTFPALYTPHSPDEKYLQSRDEILSGFARRLADPWDGRPSKAGHFIALLKTRYPQFTIVDLSPILDELRSIKDDKEIALIRKASKLAALGIVEAMKSTQVGVKEYQLEASASFVFKNNGARGLSYNAIVGGGTNAWMGHYSANADSLQDGDLVLMDVAPDYHYYTSDLARMWPVNGQYSPDQRTLYGFVIAYHKAFMRQLRPGITADQVLDAAAADMQKVFATMQFSKGIYRQACERALSFRGHVQHPVGMSVHDVGNFKAQPLRAGQVFSIDPMLWIPEEKLYIRMEDVVVITPTGVENLSASLPIEMDDIENVMKQQGLVQFNPALFPAH
ncbi:MAG: aminopeptidase P family protein [Paraglaciecola sp.]|nr:aminopeptidase P family protein [Paraglaciecola sp.]